MQRRHNLLALLSILIISACIAVPGHAFECTNAGAGFTDPDDGGFFRGTACGDNSVAASFATAIGYSSNASGIGATALGTSAMATNSSSLAIDGNSSGFTSIAIGWVSSATADSGVAIGPQASVTATDGVSLGSVASASGVSATALGVGAQATSGAAVAVGNQAAASGTFSTAMGSQASADGASSTAVGVLAFAGTEGSTALGDSSSASGTDSTALGQFALAAGAASTAVGDNAIAGGLSSMALGANSLANGLGVAVGNEAKANGTASLALGPESVANAAGSVAIGYRALSDESYTVVLGSIEGVNAAPQNARVAIGTTSPAGPLHVFRDDATQEMLILESDDTTGPQDRAMMDLSNNGGIRFQFSNNSLATAWRFQAATGAEDRFEVTKVGTGDIEMALDASGNLEVLGTVTEMSDRAAKQDINGLDGDAVLERLAQVPVSEWSYKRDPGARHIGPMAQDFHAAFGLGMDDTRISARDMAGVNMAAVKALEARNRELEQQTALMKQRNSQLEARLVQLESLVQSILPSGLNQ